MPKNNGTNPFTEIDEPPMIDIKYACGIVARFVNPNQRKWDLRGFEFDIDHWQPSTAKEYTIIFPQEQS